MKYYSYFPGCSLEATATAYGLSTQAISSPLEVELIELEDWNCCGSTPYGSLAELESVCVAARNLALAEKRGLDVVTPCSSCYTTLGRVNSRFALYPDLKGKVAEVLSAAGLEYHGRVKVRHLWEVIFNDIGLKVIKSKVVNPLGGLRVASYYGCQLVRPETSFDNPECPQTLDQLVTALEGEATPFPMKSRCCGGSLIISEEDLTLGLIHQLLSSAVANGAECIITVCPLCQLNLDAYQGMVNRKFKTKYNLPILFFTQLIGLALGIEPKALGLERGIVSPEKVLAKWL